MGQRTWELQRQQSFDVIHLHMPNTAASAAAWRPLIGSKTLFDTHDWFKLEDELYFNVPRLPRRLAGMADRLERVVAWRHDGVAVTTPLLSGVPGRGKKTFVVPNIVDTKHFRPGPSKFRDRHFGRRTVIAFLGQVAVHQGFFELLGAMKLVLKERPGSELLVIGGGFIERARSFAASLGISEHVHFTGPGRVPYEELPDLLNAADVAVSPLRAAPRWNMYSQPLKEIEYLACGRTTVVTPLKEQSRLVSESQGGVVADGFGAEAVARAISEALKRGGLAGGASRKYIEENHSPGVVIDKLAGAYEALI